MSKKYIFKNAIVYISGDIPTTKVIKATETFLHKVIKENDRNGNNDKTRDIREK